MTTTPPGDPGPAAEQGSSGGESGAAAQTAAGTSTDGPPGDSRDGGPRVGAQELRDLARMRRTVGPQRYVAGVGGGLARHLDVDPVVIRVVLAVLVFFGGAGLLLYAVGWLVVPEEGTERAALSLDPRSRTVALVGTCVLASLALLGDALGGNWFPWPLALLALVVFLVVTRRDRTSARSTAPPTSDPSSPYPSSPYPSSPYPSSPYPSSPPPFVAPHRPPNPRRRGPRLFTVTLAAVAFAAGVLSLADVAGLSVAPPVYPAVALGVVAAMLLLASVWGRGGGLVALGLLAGGVLVLTSLADRFEGERQEYRPVTASEVAGSYEVRAGELVLDLSRVGDLDRLDGRTIDVRAGLGTVEVVVPEDVDVEAFARVGGPGGLTVLGEDTGGVATEVTARHDGGTDVPRLEIDAEVGVGEITVRTR